MSRRPHLFTAAALLLLAWGVFTFGAVYTWAHASLLTFAVAVSALGFLAARGSAEKPLRAWRPLAVCLALLLVAASLQVIPLPASAITALAPARDDVDYRTLYAQRTLREIDATAAAQPPRTLSLEPARTRLGLAFIACLGALLLGAASGFTAVRPTTFLRGVIVLGVLAAFATLVQLTLTGQAAGRVYGMFPPMNTFQPAAPLMNPNHTAGVLVMAAAAAMGYLASCVAVGWRRVKPEWRERMLWFASRDGAESMLVAFAVMVMATGVIATQSRSGVLTLIIALALFVYVVVRRQSSRAATLVVLVGSLVVMTGAASLAGLDGITRRFASMSTADPTGRSAIWQSALSQARDFPLTGTGLNTFGVASLHYQDPSGRAVSANLEAHNDYLQIAAEGGLLLGIPALAAILSLATLIRRRFTERRDDARIYWVRVGAVIALAAIACQALVDFTLQMPGAATMFVLLAAVAVHRPS
jgi:O-antigen ligase